jgi:hypothetical protein
MAQLWVKPIANVSESPPFFNGHRSGAIRPEENVRHGLRGCAVGVDGWWVGAGARLHFLDGCGR